jgi:putative ABC transport system permease protein
MPNVSLYKVFRDIAKEKTRTVIVICAIFLGVLGVATMATSYLVLDRNLRENYLRTNPASFVVVTERVDGALLTDLKALPGIEDVEERDSVMARFRTGPDTYIPLVLFSIDRFSDLRINRFTLEAGRFPEADNQIVIERTGKKMLPLSAGERYPVRIPGKGAYSTELSGLVHDPGLPPSWMEGTFFGYVTKGFGGMDRLGSNEQTVLFTVSGNKYDVGRIQDVAVRAKAAIEASGRTVLRTQVPKPGEHAHQSQMDSLMFLLLMFSLLTLFLSSFLIINMISAIMAREVRQIGVMKAIGATTGKIARVYLLAVLVMAACATAIATPLGVYAGGAYARFVASMLNFTIFNPGPGAAPIAGIVLVGLVLPCLISLFPIYRRSSVSVFDALNDYGVDERSAPRDAGKSMTPAWAARIPKTLLLAFRNTFRRRGRLVLTLLVLTLGGAVFITTFNLRSSTTRTIRDKFDNQKFDLAAVLEQPRPLIRLESIMPAVGGIARAEYWGSAKITRVLDRGLDSAIIDFRGVPVPSAMFFPEMIAGSWLVPLDREVVVNHTFAARHPDAAVGKKIRLRIGGSIEEVTVKGIIREVFATPTIYADYAMFAAMTRTQDTARMIMVGASGTSPIAVAAVSRATENRLETEGIDVRMMYEKLGFKARMVDHLAVITSMLIMMTLLIILVGGLGIVTTMGINMVERRREMGILRALGTTDRALFRIVSCEGLTNAFISWVCASLLALPVSYYLGNMFFRIFFETTINFTVSPIGIVAWFFIDVAFSIVAIYFPARAVTKTSVSATLAYE